ncbi:MAG: hypothetical protein KAH01_04420 [Caldisericia bacterium]|nr:hypothetical protein [Caldisericia bacterium]
MGYKRRLAFVSYDGSKFHGFAKNKQVSTVQYSIETTLARSFRKDFSHFHGISFSSRTDAGVHAIEHPIVFNAPAYFTNQTLEKIMNHRGSQSIHVNSVQEVPLDFDLRSNIQKKEYWYVVSTEYPGVFLSKYSWTLPYLVNMEVLQRICTLLEGRNDYYEFAKDAKKYYHTICDIESVSVINIEKCEKPYEIFPFTPCKNTFIISVIGNRFMYNQVRRMCGFLFHISCIKEIDCSAACFSDYNGIIKEYSNATKLIAPAQGLYLKKVWIKNIKS